MAANNKKRRREKESKEIGLSKLTERQERFLVYTAVILVILILFALEPGFFLGLILGVLGYRYYLDNYSKSGEAESSK